MCEACRAAKLRLIGACVAVGEGRQALPPVYSREMFGASGSVREEETKSKEKVAGEGVEFGLRAMARTDLSGKQTN